MTYPTTNLVEKGRPRTITKRCGSTTSLLQNIFTGSVLVCSIGAITKIFAMPLLDWYLDESVTVDVFTELCSNFIQFVRGKWKRDEVAGENFHPGNLPLELWGEIGKRLVSRLDILRFRSVCKGWRSTLPCPTRFPLLVPSPPGCDPEFCNMPYFITEVCLYRCKGAHERVAFEEVDRGGKFRGRYTVPWKSKCVFPMISFTGFPKRRRSKISFIAKGYQLRMGLPLLDSHHVRVEGQWDLQECKFVKKIVLISSNVEHGVSPSYARASDLSVVAHLSWGGMEGRLALLRLGGSPGNWDWDTHFCSEVFKAIGTYQGHLCTLDHWGRVFLMDYYSLRMTQVGPSLPFYHPAFELPLPFVPPAFDSERKYLVESRGDLYAVELKETGTEAYKLSFRHWKWLKPTEDIRHHTAALIPYII